MIATQATAKHIKATEELFSAIRTEFKHMEVGAVSWKRRRFSFQTYVGP